MNATKHKSWAQRRRFGNLEADPRPGIRPETIDVSLKVMQLASELHLGWKEHRASLDAAIDTPFPHEKIPTDDDGWIVYILLTEIGEALAGLNTWTGIRRAGHALVARHGVQDRQFECLVRCREALRAWRAIPRRNSSANSIAADERFVASALRHALVEQERRFSSLRAPHVRKVLVRARSNASPVSLLVELAEQAQLNPTWTQASLKGVMKKRQLGTR
jgi:hypothetical protein